MLGRREERKKGVLRERNWEERKKGFWKEERRQERKNEFRKKDGKKKDVRKGGTKILG